MGNTILHGDTLSQISSVEIWHRKSCGSKGTTKHYRNDTRRFFKYAGVKPDDIIAQWKRVKYDYSPREQFIDEWTEKIEEYVYNEDLESYDTIALGYPAYEAGPKYMRDLKSMIHYNKFDEFKVMSDKELDERARSMANMRAMKMHAWDGSGRGLDILSGK